MRHGGRPLAAAFVDKVTKPGDYGDGRGGYGLILRVHTTANGRTSKRWVQRIRRTNGKVTHLSLGHYPMVGLRAAREVALDNAVTISQGIDPRAPGTPTVTEALERVIDIHRARWKNGSHSADEWRASFTNHLPDLLDLRVDKVTTAQVMNAIGPLWTAKHDTAKKVRQRLSLVFRWAVATGYRLDDPAGEALLAALPSSTNGRNHHKALPPDQVAGALAVIEDSQAWPTTKLVLRFLALTAVRSGEARGALWDEVDLDAGVWTIPGKRTKTGREFRVPLPTAALGVLTATREWSDPTGLVFPSATGRQLTPESLSKLCHELGLGMTPHGFRSSFRDWCAESGVVP